MNEFLNPNQAITKEIYLLVNPEIQRNEGEIGQNIYHI
jgi:predicted metalloprotease